MIPKELTLYPRALAKFERWITFIRAVTAASNSLQKQFDEAFEEDCVVSGDVVFEVYTTGLGSIITARLRLLSLKDEKWAKIDLSVNDDGELTPDEWLS